MTKFSNLSVPIPSVEGIVPPLKKFLGQVGSRGEMLKLSGGRGDWCVRTDEDGVAYALWSMTPLGAWTWEVVDAPAGGSGATLLVDGVPVTSYDLDTTLPIASDIGAYSISGTDAAIAAATSTLTGATLVNPKINAIKDTNGNESLRINAAANAVNFLRLDNSPAGSSPTFLAVGADPNISIILNPKGTTPTVSIYASAAANARLAVGGSATDVGLNVDVQGAGRLQVDTVNVPTVSSTDTLTNKTVDLASNPLTGTTAQFNTALSDNDFATIAGTETLSGKTLTAPKIVGGGFIADTNGNEQIVFGTTASAVNQIRVTNAATTGRPTISAEGDDTNIDLNLVPKGAGTVRINGANAATQGVAETFVNKTLTSPKITSGNAPATAASTGTVGQVEWASGFVYVCVAANTWQRAALSTW